MAKKRRKGRKRVNHKVDPHSAVKNTPLWQVHRMLANRDRKGQHGLIKLLIDVGHTDAKMLAIEFGMSK